MNIKNIAAMVMLTLCSASAHAQNYTRQSTPDPGQYVPVFAMACQDAQGRALPPGSATCAAAQAMTVSGTVTANQGAPNAGGGAAWYVQWSGQSVAVSALPSLPAGSNVIGAVTQSGGPWSVSGTIAATQSGTWNVGLNAGSNAIGSVSVSNFPASTNQGTANAPYNAWPVYETVSGFPVSSSNALPAYEAGSSAAAAGITPAVTPSGTTLAAKTSAGNLYAYAATNLSATAGFVAVINATAAPASGTAISPLECRILPASGSTDKSYNPGPPPNFSTGVVVLISTSCSTYTPGGNSFIQALVR